MGKKTKEPETETETDDVSTEDINTETETEKSKKKDKTLLTKFNKLSKKTKLYLGIFIVLLLAGIFMWYKNRKTLAKSNQQLTQPSTQIESINPQLQQIIPNNTITLPQVVQPPNIQAQVVQPNIQAQLSNPISPQNIFS